MVVPSAVCTVVAKTWIECEFVVKALIEHEVVAKAWIQHEVVAEAWIMYKFVAKAYTLYMFDYEKNNLATILSEKEISSGTKIPSPHPPPPEYQMDCALILIHSVCVYLLIILMRLTDGQRSVRAKQYKSCEVALLELYFNILLFHEDNFY